MMTATDTQNAAERRGAPRYFIDAQATLVLRDREVPVRIRDISRNGAQVALNPDDLDLPRAHVEALRIAGQPPIAATTSWALFGGLLGISFLDEVAAEDAMMPLLGA